MNLLYLPLDIHHLIILYLHPYYLLSLSLVNKFYNNLLHKRHKFILHKWLSLSIYSSLSLHQSIKLLDFIYPPVYRINTMNDVNKYTKIFYSAIYENFPLIDLMSISKSYTSIPFPFILSHPDEIFLSVHKNYILGEILPCLREKRLDYIKERYGLQFSDLVKYNLLSNYSSSIYYNNNIFKDVKIYQLLYSRKPYELFLSKKQTFFDCSVIFRHSYEGIIYDNQESVIAHILYSKEHNTSLLHIKDLILEYIEYITLFVLNIKCDQIFKEIINSRIVMNYMVCYLWRLDDDVFIYNIKMIYSMFSQEEGLFYNFIIAPLSNSKQYRKLYLCSKVIPNFDISYLIRLL
ncbi:F-box domain-containing protein [Orpheovirus IHUMI-LCC2]|uniref:F-box domain-containing protein n=1 Tax=Orpheovirus IHUMI-LCC2 TaxID=2023057 RepID=A0A2I2L3Z2_9VIRU|nr:F-box domain-containing protein [Orpheovirus IHUMI-LCC2]SNW62237.1 F-box domain-containing protein [Orpheovirus IHUMI-LCC2]